MRNVLGKVEREMSLSVSLREKKSVQVVHFWKGFCQNNLSTCYSIIGLSPPCVIGSLPDLSDQPALTPPVQGGAALGEQLPQPAQLRPEQRQGQADHGGAQGGGGRPAWRDRAEQG